MGWDRVGLWTAIVCTLAMMAAPMAWSGGPLGTGASLGPRPSSGPSFQGSGDTSGSSSQSSGQSPFAGANLNASYASATANGLHGGSPAVDVKDTGAGYNVGASYRFENLGGSGTYLNLQAGFSSYDIGGSPTRYEGGTIWGGQWVANGDTISTRLKLSLPYINADFGLAGGTGGYLGSGLDAGLRLQWLQYIDTFTFTNITRSTFLPAETSDRNKALFGIGAFASMALPNFGLSSPYGSLSPAISVAGTVGQGGGARYVWLEGFLKLWQGSLGFSDSAAVAVKIGWIYMDFKETLDQHYRGVAAFANEERTSNVAYSLNIPVVKVALGF